MPDAKQSAFVEFAIRLWLRGETFEWTGEMLAELTDEQVDRVAARGKMGDGLLAELGYRHYKSGIGQEPEAREWDGIMDRDLAPYDTRFLRDPENFPPTQKELPESPPPPPGAMTRDVDKEQMNTVRTLWAQRLSEEGVKAPPDDGLDWDEQRESKE